MKLRTHLKQLALVVAGLLLSLSFSTSAWSGPTATPPNVNELPPLNSSTMPQVKGNGTLANNVLLAISGTTVANRLFAWDNMSVVDDLTVGSLAGTGIRPVCVDTDHKLVICAPACGNSFIETGAGEQCDDGNTNNGDGCSSTCQNEGASPVCGNNVIEGTEQCDDGNTDNGDGCSSVCMNEILGDNVGVSNASLDISLTTVDIDGVPVPLPNGFPFPAYRSDGNPETVTMSTANTVSVFVFWNSSISGQSIIVTDTQGAQQCTLVENGDPDPTWTFTGVDMTGGTPLYVHARDGGC